MLHPAWLAGAAGAALLLSAASATAAPCRDAHGKFMACPAKTAPATQRCRAPNGAFAKCDSPGAKPIAAAPTGTATNTAATAAATTTSKTTKAATKTKSTTNTPSKSTTKSKTTTKVH